MTSEESIDMSSLELILTRVVSEMNNLFCACVDKMVALIDQKLTVRLDASDGELHTLAVRIDCAEKKITSLTTENENLKVQIKSLQQQVETIAAEIDELDPYGRSENMILHGLQQTQPENPDDLKQKVVESLNRNYNCQIVSVQDISVAHRLPRKPAAPNATHDTKPPPVIIRFIRRDVRNKILYSRKELKGKQTAVSEQLNPKRADLLRKANSLVASHRILSAWSHDGKVLIKKLDGSTVLIRNEQVFDF